MTYKEARKTIIEDYQKQELPLERKVVKRSDKGFIKIGLRIKMLEYPVYGVGRAVHIGERDYLKDLILKNSRIRRVKLTQKISSLSLLEQTTSNEGFILIPSSTYTDLITNSIELLGIDIVLGSNFDKILGKFKPIVFPQTKLDKIIILEKNHLRNAVDWDVVESENKTPLFIQDKQDGTWEIYSLNKIKLNPENIRIIDLN